MINQNSLAAWMRETMPELVSSVVNPMHEIATSNIVARLIVQHLMRSTEEFSADEIEAIAFISLTAIISRTPPEGDDRLSLIAYDIACKFRHQMRLYPMHARQTGIPHTTHQRCNPDSEPLH